ncbi:MAG TPA: diguanylate cyclase [Solirubrobacterales bacterium]|nr:diguanylate cyclase [Solirubrobacterales bacterium]
MLVIAFGAIAAGLFVHADNVNDLDQLEREEASRAAQQTEAVAAFSIGQLSTSAAFVQAQDGLDAHEFEVLGRSLLEEGVLNSTAYVERVPGPMRAGYERRQGVEITERGRAPAKLQRAAVRGVYYPLTYAVADGKTQMALQRAFGFDLGSDPERAPYLQRAADTGKPVATPVIDLVLGGAGINVYRAVYRDGAPTGTVDERRAALVGFVVGSFRARDLVATAVGALPDEAETQLRAGREAIYGEELDEAATTPIRIADRNLLLVVRDPDGPDISLPLLLGVIGIALATLLGSLILVWSRNEKMQELEREASEDPLTGLKNRRRFDEDLRTAMARARRERTTGAMLMLDLDHFKAVNDNFGHPAGDRLIVEIADVLRRRTRESDSLGRLGGDEFAVVLPRCSREEALLTAEAIARAVREHVPANDGAEPITVCVGVAMFGADPRQGAASVASQADAAMYAAKDAGRDEVRIFDPEALREDHPS